jgi:hypothetical protein
VLHSVVVRNKTDVTFLLTLCLGKALIILLLTKISPKGEVFVEKF